MHSLQRNTHWSGISENKAHSLYRNAWDVHLILDTLPGVFDIASDEVDGQGDSNGAMTITGVAAYAPLFDRILRDVFAVDPCIAQKLGIADIKKFLQHPQYPFKEIFTLGKESMRLVYHHEVTLGDLAGTVEASTAYLAGNLCLTRAVLWGDFGHLAAHLPADQQLRYYMFDHSIGNHKQFLRRIIRGSTGDARPGVTWEVHPGTHLSIVNPNTVEAKLAHFALAS